MPVRLSFFLITVAIVVSGIATSFAKFPATKQIVVDPWVPNSSCKSVDVVVDGRNRVHIVWSKRLPYLNNVVHLYYRCYDSNGQPLTDTVKITWPGYGTWGTCAIGCNSQGKLAIASFMLDSATMQKRPFLWISDSLGILQPPIEFGNDLIFPFSCCNPAVAVTESGRIILAWENHEINDGDSSYYEVYDENNQRIVSRAASSGEYRYGYADFPRISVAPSGRFVIVWQANHGYDLNWPFRGFDQIHGRVFDADGNPLSNELMLSCEGYPDSCRGDTSIFLNGDISGQRPDVALEDNGDFAVSYMRDLAYDCQKEFYILRKFYADGTPKGPNVKINDRSDCHDMPQRSWLSSDSAGNLLVVFQLHNPPRSPDKWDIFGQRYSVTGERVGDVYRFNDVLALGNTGPVEIMSADANESGLVAVAWWDAWGFVEGWNVLLTIMDVSDIGFYIAGDANDDRIVDVSDAVFLIGYIFSGGYGPKDVCGGDASGDQFIDISDVVVLVNYIFGGGTIPGLCPGQ